MKVVSALEDNPPLKYSILIVLILETVAVLLVYVDILKFDKHIGLAVFGGLPLLLITLIQIYTGSLVQRANLIKDIATKLYTDKDLALTFYCLVYQYTDDKLKEYQNGDAAHRAIMNKDRAEGCRFYDPATVSGEEERRLDAILGFLDMVAYHYRRGLIQMRDIAGVLGYHLSVLLTRTAVTDYRNSMPKFWRNSETGKQFGNNAVPLRYLNVLLDDFKKYSKTKLERVKTQDNNEI